MSNAHTMEQDFEHFLAYSGFASEPAETIEKLKVAYEANWSPTPLHPVATTQAGELPKLLEDSKQLMDIAGALEQDDCDAIHRIHAYIVTANQAADAVPVADDKLKRDAKLYRVLKKRARLVNFDGGNSGAWEVCGIPAYENWSGNKFNHKTFDGAVDALDTKENT